MASKKSKILAIAFCAAVMAGIHVNPVLAYYGQEDFNYQKTTTESGLNNPEIHHTVDKGKFNPDSPVHTDGDVNCKEEVANSNITVGDMNKVTADLVANDEKIYSEVKELKGQVGKGDTDTHVKEGAATVDDNGNVTMDIVDKNGNDTGKDVTISGLASDKELEGVKNELQQQIKSIDVEDTNTQINEGTYTAEADGTVNMDVVDKVTGEVTKDAVTIEGLASDSELATETQNRTDSDTKLQGQINDNATAIATETQKRTEADTKLQANINAEAEAREKADAAHDQAISDLEVENDKQDSAIAGLDVKLQEEADARQEADADLQDQIDGHTNQIDSMGDQLDDLKANDEKQDDRLDGVEAVNDAQDDRLDGVEAVNDAQDDRLDGVEAVNDAQDDRLDGVEAVNDAQDDRLDGVEAVNDAQDDRLDAHDVSIKNHEAVMGVSNTEELHNAYSSTNYISGANDMVEADVILDREISRVDGRVDRLENRVDGLEDRIDKVGAMAAAIANLRTMGYDPAAPTEVAVGVGQYRDETGMALGLFHYPNRDFMLSLSVSTSGDEYMGGIGATWKFGRKSPEKVAEIKKAQAEADARRAEEQKLAKAEEMKKAAKEAKVQAQMERHAKLAAERAALEEA